MQNIFSHRGLPRAYAENTFSGINKSFDYVEFAETDVRITKDHELILHHDAHIDNYFLKDLTIQEIANLLLFSMDKEGIEVSGVQELSK